MALTASVFSVAALAHYFHAGELLLYGDAVAHINIARRVADSLTPGVLQLGTVWLPLPHLLMLPFVVSDWAWRTGVGGAVPSMVSYVVATVGVFRLTRMFTSRVSAWIAVLVFALNPNLLYMQTTGMTEALFLSTVIWSVYFFCHFVGELRVQNTEGAGRALGACAIALSAAMFTRYDGWFLTVITGWCALAVFMRADAEVKRQLRRRFITFIMLAALSPTLWLAYNYGVFGNALEFLTGPYSARAIQQKTTHVMGSRHPGDHDLKTAWFFYLKTAKLNTGEGRWQPWLFGVAVFAGLISLLQARRRALLLLWVPLLFYTLSIAYGSVPIFVPEWWPHAYVNVRYGMQLLPAVAVFFALAVEMVRQVNYSERTNRVAVIVAVALVLLSQASVWMAVPICLREARANSVARVAVESAMAAELRKLPAWSRLMMFSGTHGGALQRAGIPFKRVLNEGNHPQWDQALKAPATGGDYIVAGENDMVGEAVARNADQLEPIYSAKVEGERVKIFKSKIYSH